MTCSAVPALFGIVVERNAVGGALQVFAWSAARDQMNAARPPLQSFRQAS